VSENISYEITIEKVTDSELEKKAEVLLFYQGGSFHTQMGVGPVEVDLREGDVLLVLRHRARLPADEATRCARCGSPLKDGFCTDRTCPFDRHPQTCSAGWSGHPAHIFREGSPPAACEACASSRNKEEA